MKEKMYEIKAIVPNFDIKLPTCMYPVKPFMAIKGDFQSQSQSQSSSGTTIDGRYHPTDNSPEIAKLEIRQQKVFQQLQDLKNQLLQIRKQFNLPSELFAEEEEVVEEPKEPLQDIVINANPQSIPYGLLALQNLWKGIFDIDITTFSHSSISKIPKTAEDFQNVITQNKNKENLPSISVTLIWKNCEHTEMVCSPAAYVPIYGEVNVLRYLARVGPKKYRYEEQLECNETDAILDICYQITRSSTSKTKSQFLRSLSNRLQQRTYFLGDKISIADIAVYGTLRRIFSTSQKDIAGNLNDWLKRIEEIIKL